MLLDILLKLHVINKMSKKQMEFVQFKGNTVNSANGGQATFEHIYKEKLWKHFYLNICWEKS